jgi:hypothetical protein
MDKAFQPLLKQIEERRRREGWEDYNYKNRILWADLDNTGYCTAISVMLDDLGQAVLKRFPKEIPAGASSVGWDAVRKRADLYFSDLAGDVERLTTLYYDKKNETYYQVGYEFTNKKRGSTPFSVWRVGASYDGHPDGMVKRRFMEIHYRNLLDDLSALFKAGQRDHPNDPAAAIQAGRGDKLLMLQILQLRQILLEKLNWDEDKPSPSIAFLEAEDKRHGDLMKVFKGVQLYDLDENSWLLPDWCHSGDTWWPCSKAGGE